MTKKISDHIMFEYLLLTIGTFSSAFGLVFFLKPHTIAPGGVTGLAIVIQKVFGIPMDITNLVINLPMFIVGVFVLGKKFGVKAVYGTLSISVFMRLIMIVLGENINVVHDILLSSLYGGVFVGMGIGLVFRAGGSTGGTDLAGSILNKYFPDVSKAKFMMIFDFFVVLTAGAVNKSLEISLYSALTLYIIVKMADFIVEGLNYAKAFYIISEHGQIIGEEINKKLYRGVTVLNGRGMYTGNSRDVLLCVIDRSQITKLKKLVYEIDENAFVIVNTVHEVLGEGFKR
ncbi:YitT family protein [Lutibacter sp. B2]|nr:YitT family protein [Lutibacter sp. B2]